MFYCEFCEVSKNVFYYRTHLVAASMLIEIGYWLSPYNYKRKPRSFMMNKMFIEIRLCYLARYVFKGHEKIAKVYMVKFNASILNRLKITGFGKYKVNT